MKNIRLTRNPYLLFSPFLLFYIVVVLLLQSNIFWGDELSYLTQAKNILHGFYSPPAPNIQLRNGPGYPIILVPFVALHVPLVYIKLLNAFFLYLSIVFLFKALIQMVSFRKALIAGLFWGCYYNALDFIFMLYSEVFTVFLVSVLVYFLIKAFDAVDLKKSKKYIYGSGFILGYIVLTKVIFGYVLLFMLIGSALLWLINRHAANYKRGIIILFVAFATVIPYLSYTYYLTGRVFYWSTTGGNNLYWMSGLAEEEYGSWFPDPATVGYTGIPLVNGKEETQQGGQLNLKNRTIYTPGAADSIKLHHQKYFEEINKYTGVERDDAYKRVVMEKIKSHPGKFIKNCISNIGRILFNYPYSYTPQKPGTLFRLPLNGILVVLILFCLVPTFLNWQRIIYPLRFLLFIALLYLGGSIFGSAEIRMFTVIVPILLVWIACIIQKTMKINLKFD